MDFLFSYIGNGFFFPTLYPKVMCVVVEFVIFNLQCLIFGTGGKHASW